MKSDRKGDDLDELEKTIRNELREEIKSLKKELDEKTDELEACNLVNIKQQAKIHQLTSLTAWMQSHLNYCHDHRPDECPLLQHIGAKQFEKLTGDKNEDRKDET